MDDLTEFAVSGCRTLGLMPVNHRLRELNQAPAALSRALALDLMRVQIAHRKLIPTDAAPHRLVTSRLVPLNIRPGELQIAKAAPHRLIAMLLMVLQFRQRFLFLAKPAASRATQATMWRRIAPFHPLKAHRALIVWQLIITVAICVVRGGGRARRLVIIRGRVVDRRLVQMRLLNRIELVWLDVDIDEAQRPVV